MGLKGVVVNQVAGGLGRRGTTDDGTCLLVIGGVTSANKPSGLDLAVISSKLKLENVKRLLNVKQAEDLGIDAAYDDAKHILAHYHISEFFRISPNGTLFIALGALTDAQLKAILRANIAIKTVGMARNSTTAIADMKAHAAGFQKVVTDLRAESRNVSAVILEGTQFATAHSAYPDAATYVSPNVAIMVGQDPTIREKHVNYQKTAAVGTVLGAISVRKVSENIGSIDIESKPDGYKGLSNYPLTDLASKRWTGAVLQNGTDVNTLDDKVIKDLSDKGYLFVVNYNGYPGYYFVNSRTCTAKTSDFAYIENNRTWNKAADLVRAALLPRVKSNLLKDPNTGFLRDVEVKELEALGERALDGMLASEEISGRQVYIDPEQIVTDDNPLKIKGQIVANNIIFEMSFDLGLVNKLDS